MTDDLKEAVERLTSLDKGLRDPRVHHLPLVSPKNYPALAADLALVLSALKAAERPQPVPGDGEGVKALADDTPFRVNSDGWGDVWIETASGRRIGDLDPRIDADELNEAFAAPSRVSTPGREEIARVIDPDAWEGFGWNAGCLVRARRKETALAKADAIIALRRSEPRGDDSPLGFASALASGGNRDPEPSSAAGAWVTVPREPTREMLDAGYIATTTDFDVLDPDCAKPAWIAMIASAPKAEVEGPLALVTTQCFECGHDLNGPWCPACNPEGVRP